MVFDTKNIVNNIGMVEYVKCDNLYLKKKAEYLESIKLIVLNISMTYNFNLLSENRIVDTINVTHHVLFIQPLLRQYSCKY